MKTSISVAFHRRMIQFFIRTGLYAPLKEKWYWLLGHNPDRHCFWSRYIQPGSLCFDVGADLGWWIRIMRKYRAQVIAIEPQPRSFHRLEAIFRSDPDVFLVPAALGATVGTGTMRVSSASPLSSMSNHWVEAVSKSQRFTGFTWNREIQVKTTTLDQLINIHGKPDFIKIDVEGYEDQVIAGLSQPVSHILFEFNGEFLLPALDTIRYLSQLGDYRFNFIQGSANVWLLSDWVDSELLMMALFRYDQQPLHGEVLAIHQP